MKTFPLEHASPIYITKISPNISLKQTEENVKGRL